MAIKNTAVVLIHVKLVENVTLTVTVVFLLLMMCIVYNDVRQGQPRRIVHSRTKFAKWLRHRGKA